MTDVQEVKKKKPRNISPTELSLRLLRAEGFQAAVVERWNPHARIRQDLFGFIDLLALRGPLTLAVQATTESHVSERIHKIADSPNVAAVREAGWRIEVWGWGKVAGRWSLTRRVDVS